MYLFFIFVSQTQTQKQKQNTNIQIYRLLIMPVARLSRYKLLLNELIKYTNANHPNLPQLENVVQKLTEVMPFCFFFTQTLKMVPQTQCIDNRINQRTTKQNR